MTKKEPPLDPERGARLKAHRKRLGLVQRQVAERIGAVVEVVSRHERGGNMESDNLMAYAALYGVTADSIMGDSAPLPVAAATSHTPQAANAIPMSLARLLTDGRCNPLTDDEMQRMIRHCAEGNSTELDDLEIHLLGIRAERDKTEAALDAFRAAVRRVRKERGQGAGALDRRVLTPAKSKKSGRRTEVMR